MEPKNIPEFIALIKRYESITLEEIEATGFFLSEYYAFSTECSTIQNLTGFGNNKTCSLCRSVRTNCYECIYGHIGVNGCSRGNMGRTYDLIYESETSEMLLYAIKERIIAMRQYAANIGINIE